MSGVINSGLSKGLSKKKESEKDLNVSLINDTFEQEESKQESNQEYKQDSQIELEHQSSSDSSIRIDDDPANSSSDEDGGGDNGNAISIFQMPDMSNITSKITARNMTIGFLSSHVSFMYYILTEYSGKQIMDKDTGVPAFTSMDDKWQRSFIDSFIVLTVFANCALSIYSLNRAFDNMPSFSSLMQNRRMPEISSLLAGVSSVTLALLFVASCDEAIRSFKEDNPGLNEAIILDMKAATLSVLSVYTLLFYPDLKPAYKQIGSALSSICKIKPSGVFKDLRNSFRDYLLKLRVEYVFKKAVMKLKNFGDSYVMNQDKINTDMQYIQNNADNILKLMNHRSVGLVSVTASILTYFDIGLLLGSVTSIKNGISELVNMFSGHDFSFDKQTSQNLEFVICAMIAVSVPIFVNFGVQGARVGSLFLGNLNNAKAAIFGLGVLASTILLPRMFASMTDNFLATLLLSAATMASAHLLAERCGLAPKDALRQSVGMMLVMLSGMAFFATTYISELAARGAKESPESHPFDEAGAVMFEPFDPLLAAMVGFCMAGSFNIFVFDNALHPALNRYIQEIIDVELERIKNNMNQNNVVANTNVFQNALGDPMVDDNSNGNDEFNIIPSSIQGDADVIDHSMVMSV